MDKIIRFLLVAFGLVERGQKPPKFWVRQAIPFRGRLMDLMAGGAVEKRTDYGGVYLVADQTLDIADATAVASVNTNVTIAGLLTTDAVVAIPPVDIEAGLVVQTCQVSAANTAVLRITNPSAGAINAASNAGWDFLVFRR